MTDRSDGRRTPADLRDSITVDEAHWMDYNRLALKSRDSYERYEYRGVDYRVDYYDDVQHKGVNFRGVIASVTHDGQAIARVIRTWKREDTNYIFYSGGLEGYLGREEALQVARERVEHHIDEYFEEQSEDDEP